MPIILRKALYWLILGLTISFLVLAGWFYRPLPINPSAEVLSQAASEYSVEIVRDNWGVPHIRGERDADVSFGLAYAHAEDDFETIQEVLAATRGVMARYRGSAAAPTDYLIRLLDVWGTIDARYSRDVPSDVKALAEAYVAGLNLYAAHHPDDTWQGLAPFKAEDVIAGFVFKTPLFYGLDKTLLGLFDEDRKPELALDPAPSEMAFQVRDDAKSERGSNALAVNAKRSGENATRLLINSHQPMTGPVAWYEAHLSSGETLEITGGLFPGTPVILHGFNQNLGWANTVNHIDLSDVYVLRRNPQNDLQYRLDGEWRDFDVTEVNIEIKLWGPFRFNAKRRVLRSVHGPVIEGKHGTFALRYAGQGEVRQLEQYLRLNQAQSYSQFLSAMAMNALPSINYIYADKDDNIAFIHNAQYPLRTDGVNWQKDLAGDRSDLIWHDYLDFSWVPKLVNPKSGLIFNANNTPYSATDGSDNLRAAEFPKWMGLATNQTNRSLRLMELTDGKSDINKAELIRLKFDNRYSTKSDQVNLVNKLIELKIIENDSLLAAQEHLRAWDLSAGRENLHTALAVTALRKVLRGDHPNDHSPENLLAALRYAHDYLMEKYGRLDVPWGEENRLVRGDLNIPLDGGPDLLRAIYSFGLPNGSIPSATHGDTWMALVEWDSSGQQHADVMHQFGSATRDVDSPHYADQAPLFAARKWRKALLDWDEIRANAERTYYLGAKVR